MKQPIIKLILFLGIITNNSYAQSDNKLNKYDTVIVISEDKISRVELSDKWGLIDKSGIQLTPIKYDRISGFYKEYGGNAMVTLDDKVGLINKNGEEITPIKYDNIDGFFEIYSGFSLVEVNEKYGLISKEGKEITPVKYDFIGDFIEEYGDFGIVKLNGKFGLINHSGKEVTPIKYDNINGFSQRLGGLAIVNLNGKYGLIDNEGKEIQSPKFSYVEQYADEKVKLLTVRLNGKYGFINKKGEVVIRPKYDYVEDGFSKDGTAKVELNGKLVIIDETGKVQYDKETLKIMRKLKADSIVMDKGNSDGVFKARSKETQKWGMYQFDKELIPMQYDSLLFFPFNGSFTAVYNNGKMGIYLSKWTYEDKAKQSTPCLYENYKRINVEKRTDYGITTSVYLAVKKDGKWAWIDWLTGKEKSVFTYETTEDLPYPSFEQKTWFD